MKRDNYKVLVDGSGRECRFDSEAFATAMKEKKNKDNIIAKQEKKKLTTLNELMYQIADKTGFSDEAVKKWYRGYNGPSDYQVVRVAAQMLGVLEENLVIPLSSKDEGVREMNEKEKKLVEMIYEKCIDAFYEYADNTEAIQNDAAIKQNNEFRIARKSVYVKFLEALNAIHRIIDCHTLQIDISVADRLHNIIRECIDIDDPSSMERWGEICTEQMDEGGVRFIVDTRELRTLRDCYTREDGVAFLGIWYITYEIDLAERYGHLNNRNLPEEFFDNVGVDGECYRDDDSRIPDKELLQYGCHDTDGLGNPFINARMVFKDQMVTFIREVFKHDFPEITG